MSSPAQITANRANAELSTGPRSVDGKAASARNALKFGIHAQSLVIPGEDPDDLDALATEYQRDLAPKGCVEAALVETMFRSTWMLRRLARIEAEVIRAQMASLENPGDHPLGQACLADASGSRVLESIARRQRSLQRDYFKALQLLRELRETARENEILRFAFAPPPMAAHHPENRLRFSNSPSAPPAPPLPAHENPALRL